MDIIRMERHGVPFYACNHSAWRGTAHGFSTRLGGVSPPPWDSLNLGANRGDTPEHVRENFSRFCAALGTDVRSLVKNHQVHSSNVRIVTVQDILPDPAAPGVFPADALVTNTPGLCLTIFSGDCIPILFYDPVQRCVAAAHAGWRGTAAGIAACTVQTMVDSFGCRPEDILAAIGPGISTCCFETHTDVPEQLCAALGTDAQPFLHPLPNSGKFQVDLKGVNAKWLLRSGLVSEHISISCACTACHLEEFWSHRIQGNRRGSMAAMIQLLDGGSP
ncbi:MAG: peptidoglycan editing factor PgeF [Lawsonibacter sp.]|jgi:YfiH family protein